MSEKKLNRRDFLKVSAVAVIGAALQACAQPTPTPKPAAATAAPTKPAAAQPTAKPPEPTKPAAAATAAPPTKYQEAPALAELVKAGKLPPVEQRLPSEPMVVQPNKSIGKHGGIWKMGMLSSVEGAFVDRTVAYEYLLRWDPGYIKALPNLAKSWEVSKDGTEFTFNLRKGVKWSDGAPLTAADVAFRWEDVISNTDLNPKFPTALVVGDANGVFTKVDDYTVKVKFAKPYGLFVNGCAGTDIGPFLTPVPSHYLKQFHPKYADKAKLDQMVADAKFKNWWELYGQKTDYQGRNPDRPVHHAWVQQAPPIGTAPEAILNRNPYYWKVDPEGKQLPYIDKVIFKMHQNRDTILLDAMAGQIDMQYRHIDAIANVPVLRQNADKGGYRFFRLQPMKMNQLIIWPNQTVKDPVLKKLFQNKDFRIGLSYGIDRKEINTVILAEQGEPWQPAPLRSSPFFNEQMAKRYTELDIKKANEILDKLLPNKDKDGFRLRPDSQQKLTITCETPSDFEVVWIDILQLIQNHWKKIGIDMQIKTSQRALYTERNTASEHEFSVWEGDIDYYGTVNVPTGVCGSMCWCPLWLAWWNSGGKEGEEPTEEAKKRRALYEQLRVTVDPEEQKKIIKELQDTEPLYGIGTCTKAKGYGVVKNNFMNVPDEIPDLWIYPTPAPTNPEQYWIDTTKT